MDKTSWDKQIIITPLCKCIDSLKVKNILKSPLPLLNFVSWGLRFTLNLFVFSQRNKIGNLKMEEGGLK